VWGRKVMVWGSEQIYTHTHTHNTNRERERERDRDRERRLWVLGQAWDLSTFGTSGCIT
jgi:hypothetical protein